MSKENLVESEEQKINYSLGLDIGQSFQHLPVNIDLELITQGMKDIYQGNKIAISQEDFQKTMSDFHEKMKTKSEEIQKKAIASNQKDGKAFLEENKKRSEVKVTASGLQYEILIEGDGDLPKDSDSVTVHYVGTLINGVEFDSSIKRGTPATFPVKGVIVGWTEALQMMKVGSKYKLYIPSDLAYGEKGAGQQIGPNSTLIFEVELLKIG